MTGISGRIHRNAQQGPHDAVAYGMYQGELLKGFCFAGIFRGALSGFLRKNRNFLIWQVMMHPWLVLTAFFRERLAMTWAILIHRSVPVAKPPILPQKAFGILAIAVDPQMQHAGLGKCMMLEAEKIAVERGFKDMQLTVAVDNQKAIAFYEKLGWLKIPASDGIWHGFMTKTLNGSRR
jgi:ribosomal protein S18 acetylase RimI-like enzyme